MFGSSYCRRRSERVTDLERRALAEKIRQENIKKEKELLEQLHQSHKAEEETKAAPKTEKEIDKKKTKAKDVVSPTSSSAKPQTVSKAKPSTPSKLSSGKASASSEVKDNHSETKAKTSAKKSAATAASSSKGKQVSISMQRTVLQMMHFIGITSYYLHLLLSSSLIKNK